MSDLIRILVFGTTGVGKTTLCNVLADEKEPVNDGVRGVTFKSRETKPFQIGNKNAVLIDTIGLNEGNHGTVPNKDAIKELINLFRTSQTGYNLIIHVLKKGRINILEENNYKLFIKTICQNKIPKIAVVTGCEDYDPMSNWLNKKDYDTSLNNATMMKDMDLIYNDIVCIGFPKSERPDVDAIYKNLWSESNELVCNSILKHSSEESIILFENPTQYLDLLKRTWNTFVEIIGLPSKYIWNVNKNFAQVIQENFGLTEAEMIELLKPMNIFKGVVDTIKKFLKDNGF